MHSLLRDHIARYVSFDQNEMQRFENALEWKKLRKHHYLLQAGDVCKYDHFVIQGGVRLFESDNKGKEAVIQFGFEDWWITDRYSLITGRPSTYNIEALEATEVLQIKRETLDELCLAFPKIERYFHIVLQHAYAAWQERILFLQKPAEERYLQFMRMYGGIEQRISQRHIASCLGITRETLSRLRKP